MLTKLKALAQDLESKLTPQSSIVQEITQVRESYQSEAKAETFESLNNLK